MNFNRYGFMQLLTQWRYRTINRTLSIPHIFPLELNILPQILAPGKYRLFFPSMWFYFFQNVIKMESYTTVNFSDWLFLLNKMSLWFIQMVVYLQFCILYYWVVSHCVNAFTVDLFITFSLHLGTTHYL